MPRRSSRPIIQLIGNLARIAIPLALIAAAAVWFLNLNPTPYGDLRVTTTIPGAEIQIDGKHAGAQSDTVLTGIRAGRRFVTVRAPGLISEPEVVIVEIQKGRTAVAAFIMRDSISAAKADTFSAKRGVRQDIFAEDQSYVRAIPPAPPSPEMLDYSDPDVDDFADRGTVPRFEPRVRPSSESLTESGESDSRVSDDTRKSLAGTQITVSSEPPGARILVNGARTTSSTPYTFRGLDRGYYVFSIEMPGHAATPDSIEVVLTLDGQSELAAFSLEPLEKLPIPQLTISTKPLAAGIRVNGTAVGVGSARVNADYGSVLIEFVAVPGYQTPNPTRVEITKDHPNHEVAGVYERLSGSSMIAVVPNANFPRFDGSKLRVFVDGELILDGPTEPFDVTLLGGLYPGERAVKLEYDGLVAEDIVKVFNDQVAELTIRINAAFGKRSLRFKTKTDIPLDKWQSDFKKSTILTQS
ncbi:MAG: PEGA domain-containing protein [Calditrichaeota bacterium]|nr:PEGA domain-containing protein [Calditrichota bacterium]MCB9366499.1 PEGA domain-containing protein [Calditrichota bacterium]MCB9391243.1 PEGA domain-containing protein [Calditrichota bacterium]